MSSDSITYSVEELISEGVLAPPLDGNHGEIHPKASDFVSSGIPFIMASDLKNGRVDTTTCSFISADQASKLRKGFSKTGDVLLSHKATIGRTALVEKIDSEYIVLTPQVTYYRVLEPKRLNNRYLKYYFDSLPFQQTLASWAGAGSTRAYLGITAQRKLPITFPSIEVQEAIAEMIGALDDRITLLRETNTTLEAIAQALFKSWFVDFDPVRAKLEGREPEGMDADTTALFPDSFEESELGLVPKGWQVGTVGDISCIKGGFAYKSEAFCDAGSPVIKIKNIVGDGTVNLLDTQFIADEIAGKTKRFALKDGDIVIAMTGATIGKTGVVVTSGDQIPYLNQRVAKFEPNMQGRDNSWLVFVAFQNSFISDQVVNTASGSAQPNISTTGIESVRLVIPADHGLLDVFNESVSALFQGWIANHKQAQTLATLRDTLLPRLISGQLRLPDAEALVEGV